MQQNIKCIDIKEMDKIKAEIKNTFCVVTATGVHDFMSQYFTEDDFHGVILANMGAQDEFGDKFSPQKVLHGKYPVNFAIKEPT